MAVPGPQKMEQVASYSSSLSFAAVQIKIYLQLLKPVGSFKSLHGCSHPTNKMDSFAGHRSECPPTPHVIKLQIKSHLLTEDPVSAQENWGEGWDV